MSELKTIRSGEIYNIIEYEDCFRTDDLYYAKAEADKVIEKLEKENDRLKKQSSCTFSDDCLRLRQTKRKLRYQKYKRCLAMASYWVAVSYQCVDDKLKQMAEKHHYKWLKIAEKFKEAK